MSKYKNMLEKDLPRLFITYEAGETRDKDKYAYGILGNIPISQLVGYIIRVQAELAFRNLEVCDDKQCVIMFDPRTHIMSWYVHKSIPVDALVGTLELVKCYLLDMQIAQLTGASKSPILMG